jgi:Helix-turn-helix domain
VNDDCQEIDEFWLDLPEAALHPVRVQLVEALRWIEEPLSAAALISVCDGTLRRPEVVHHLRRLEALNIVEPAEKQTARHRIDTPYRLVPKD